MVEDLIYLTFVNCDSSELNSPWSVAISFSLPINESNSLFYSLFIYVAKIVQTECRISSLLEYFAEVQPIFCKDTKIYR